MAKFNERKTIAVLLSVIILCLIGALCIQRSGKLEDTGVTTSVIDRRQMVETVTREFETPKKSETIEVSTKFQAGMKTGPRKSGMFDNVSVKP